MEVTYMEQNNKTNVWKIVLISLAISAVVAVGVVFLVKFLKKRKALKEMVIEWDDEEAFEKCMNGHGDCDIVVISDAE
jgi:anti-sigma-K factor RskA